MNDAIKEHDAQVSNMFGRIAHSYDLLNHVLSLGIDCYWRRELALSVREGATHRLLDLAAGTLDVSFALRRHHPGFDVLAMDFCQPMLVHGRQKIAARGGKRITTVTADAKKLPLPDCSVDSITIAFGIRNILPREDAFREMLRVLTPGGRACILEFGSGRAPSSPPVSPCFSCRSSGGSFPTIWRTVIWRGPSWPSPAPGNSRRKWKAADFPASGTGSSPAASSACTWAKRAERDLAQQTADKKSGAHGQKAHAAHGSVIAAGEEQRSLAHMGRGYRPQNAFQEKSKAKSLEKHTDIEICKHSILSMAQKKG